MSGKDKVSSKREQQKEARRRAIIEAGLQAFTAQGFTATRLDDVAVRAGIGKGTIYLYFDSKEALFEEVVRENLFPAQEELESLVAQFEGSATELLTTHLRYFYAGLADDKIPPLIAMVLGEGNRFPALTEFFFREMVSGNQDIMRSIIEKGVANGEFRPTDIGRFSQILIAPVLISAIWKLQFESFAPIDLQSFAETHIDLVLNGLKTP